MKPSHIVLLVLDSYGGTVQGRTLLQKVCYFADRELGLNLGYRPHYYGPFSPQVEEALGELKSLDFVQERCVGFGISGQEDLGEVRRYDYVITGDGQTVLAAVKARQPKEARGVQRAVRKIRDAGNPDYVVLSVAAKAHYLLHRAGRPMTSREILEQAKGFAWSIPEGNMRKAVGLLRKLQLVK